MKYIAPPGSTDANAGYVTGVPGIKKGSPVPSEAIEHPMREIVHVIKQAGLEPDEKDLTQLYHAIGKMMPDTGGLVTKTQIATTESTGIVQIGTGLDVDGKGVLSAKYGIEAGTACEGDDERLQYSQSLVETGWQKLPRGLLVQWGKARTNSSGYASITYPVTFNNKFLLLGMHIGTAPVAVIEDYATRDNLSQSFLICWNLQQAALTGWVVSWLAIGV